MNLFFYTNSNTNQSLRQLYPLIYALLKKNIKIYSNQNLRIEEVEQLPLKKYISINNNKNILVFNIFDYLKINKYKSKARIIFRPRGILPEESYMKNNSNIRKFLLNYIEKKVFKNCNYFCFISNEQKNHFFTKYPKLSNKINFAIINNFLNYNNNIIKSIHDDSSDEIKIVYSGGFSRWQNIDKIFEVFSILKKNYPNIKIIFRIYTSFNNFEIAKKYMNKYKVEVELLDVPQDELISKLRNNDIGIIIREKHIVNKTASPFKIQDYLHANLGIITTKNIGDYDTIFKEKPYVFFIELNNGKINFELDKFLDFISNIREYKKVIPKDIENLFNMDKEIENLINLLI